MLVIDRVSWWTPRYTVDDHAGPTGRLIRRRFSESAMGEIDGLARAEAGERGRWTISADGSEYQLRRGSKWRSNMELCRSGSPVGSIRKGRAPRGQVRCELPGELSPVVRTFVGLLVQVLWQRAAASGAG